jgi:hypothetical protein
MSQDAVLAQRRPDHDAIAHRFSELSLAQRDRSGGRRGAGASCTVLQRCGESRFIDLAERMLEIVAD